MIGGGEGAWHCKWTERAVNTERQIYIQTYTEQNKGNNIDTHICL